MTFWQSPLVATLVTLAGLLALGGVLRSRIPALRRLAVPACILAGLLGLALGPDGADVLPVDRGTLESLVYHGLGIVFIAVALQSPPKGGGAVGPGAKAFSFGIPVMVSLQAAVGLAVVVALGLLGTSTHPGLGLLLPMGFEQGPGQALSLGTAWETSGLVDGGQLGLIIAAVGFLWSIVVGVPLVAWGKRKGLLAPVPSGAAEVAVEASPEAPPGSLDRMTGQVALIGVCYVLTWGACTALSSALAGMPDIAAIVWGFHFILGAAIAMGVRALLVRLAPEALDDEPLRRVAGVVVDWMTAGALVAVQLAVLSANWLPILLVTTIGGVVTLGACLWLCSRAFPEAPFEHAIVWFGMSTGTLPLGLSLLRVVDPELRSPAALSAVIGSAGAILGVVPVLLVLVPMTVSAHASGNPNAALLALGAVVAYLGVLLAAWRFGGALRFGGKGLWAKGGGEGP